MNMLVTKKIENWLFLRRLNSKRFFLYHQTFVDKLREKYFSAIFTKYNLKNVNKRMRLELLYPFTMLQTGVPSTLINNSYFQRTHNQYVTIKNLFQHKSFLHIHKTRSSEKPNLLKNIHQYQQLGASGYNMEKTTGALTGGIFEDKLIIEKQKDRNKLPRVEKSSKEYDLLGSIMLKKELILAQSKINILRTGNFLGNQLFYDRYKGVKTLDFANKSTKKAQLTKDFTAFRLTQTKKTVELEYSYNKPAAVTGKELISADSLVSRKKVSNTFAENKEQPLQNGGGTVQKQNTMDINSMADQVYRLIEKKIQIENERCGRWC